MPGLPDALLVIDDVHIKQSLLTYQSGVRTHTIHPATGLRAIPLPRTTYTLTRLRRRVIRLLE